MFFNSYPEINYTIGNRELTLRDIFKNIAFVNVENNSAYYDYYVQDGETPEMVSAKIYGTTSYGWLILLVNNIADIKNEWFLSQEEYKRKNDADFGGNAFYIQALPDIKPGDILVKVTGTQGNEATGITSNVYSNIAGYDTTLRKIRGICGAGSFTGGDYILFARKEQSGSVIPLSFQNNEDPSEQTNYTKLLFVEPYGQSVSYFYDSKNMIINPYKYSLSGITGVQTGTLYSDPGDTLTTDNFAKTIIYKYGVCGGSMESGLFKKEIDAENYSKYIKRQKIKILKQDLVASVVNLIKNAIETNVVGKQFKIDL